MQINMYALIICTSRWPFCSLCRLVQSWHRYLLWYAVPRTGFTLCPQRYIRYQKLYLIPECCVMLCCWLLLCTCVFSLLLYYPGCKLLLYLSGFNLTTGPLHWELFLRSLLEQLSLLSEVHCNIVLMSFYCRALNNQLFVAGMSPARDMNDTYIRWGHTTACNPWYVGM